MLTLTHLPNLNKLTGKLIFLLILVSSSARPRFLLKNPLAWHLLFHSVPLARVRHCQLAAPTVALPSPVSIECNQCNLYIGLMVGRAHFARAQAGI